jgi:hypothetical protein
VPGGHRLRRAAFRVVIPGPAGALSCLLLAHPHNPGVFVKDFGFAKA